MENNINNLDLYVHKYNKYKHKYLQQARTNNANDLDGGAFNFFQNKAVSALTKNSIFQLYKLHGESTPDVQEQIDKSITELVAQHTPLQYCDKTTYKAWEAAIADKYTKEYIKYYKKIVNKTDDVPKTTMSFSRKQKDLVMLYPHGNYHAQFQIYHVGQQETDAVKLKYNAVPLECIDRLPALDVGGLTSISTAEFSVDSNNTTKLYSIVDTITIEPTQANLVQFITNVFANKLSSESITAIADSIVVSFKKSGIKSVQLFHLSTNKKSSLQYYQFIIPQSEIVSTVGNYYVRNYSGNKENYALHVSGATTRGQPDQPGQYHLSFSYDLENNKSFIVPNLNENNIKHEYDFYAQLQK